MCLHERVGFRIALRRVGNSNLQPAWDADPSGAQALEGIPAGEWYVFTGSQAKKRTKVTGSADATVRFQSVGRIP